jgi:transcription termination factor Rho
MSGEQLERSILERKEREELKAIATAMSLEPVARTKKADLVDQILRAAGVEVASANGGSGAGPIADPAPHATGAASANGKTVKPRAPRTRAKPKPAAGEESEAVGAEAAPVPAAPATPVAEGDGDRKAPSTSRSTSASGTRSTRGVSARQVDTVAAEFGFQSTKAHVSDVVETSSSGDGDRAASVSNATQATEAASTNGTSTSGAVDRHSTAEGGTQHQGQGQNRTQRPQGGGGQAPRGDGGGGGPQGGGQYQGQGGQGNQGQGNPGQGGIDQGNRRSRRRRGRGERGDRELQGPSAPQDAAWQGELVPVKGLMDLREEGYGFLRTSGYLPSSKDVYVSVSQARRLSLRRGDAVEGACRPAGPSEKYPALLRIDSINGMTPDDAKDRPRFEDLTPLFPDERLRLESREDPTNVTARIIDLISPIGKGQRGMIVSPSKAGKTTIMKQIAHSVEVNNPSVHLMVLLVDERPEEVTDMRRSVKGEVIASTFDRPADEHTALSELTMERAKRLVEMGRDVVIILDGITRLARAYNLAQPATGRIMSGGVDSGALYPPKKFFGAARNVEEGGSLTILATALIETGSKMDEVIFEEFKGTGNMELRLDRKLAERRIYPAIDVNSSSTRHEELLFDRSQLQQVWKLRRVLNALGAEGSAAAGLELLVDKIKTTRSNDEFLAEIAKAPTPSA